jgi:hypothetical protein
MQGTREKTEETSYRVLSRRTKHLLDPLPALRARQTLSVQLQAVYVAAASAILVTQGRTEANAWRAQCRLTKQLLDLLPALSAC